MDVSIIIPIYNNEKYLTECLESVINQKTKYTYEIIAVNDGSVDNSLSILNKYKNKIKIIDKQNTGPGDSRNIAINKAKGKYLLFVDSDDYVSEDFVEIMTSNIIKYDADIVICDFKRVKDNLIINVNKGEHKVYLKGNINEVLLMEFHSCNKIFKKENFINNLYPKGMLFEDIVAISLNELEAKKIVKITDKLYFYRCNMESTTNIINKSNYDILKAMEMIEESFINNNYKDEIEYLFVNNLLVDLLIKLFKGNESLDTIKVIKKSVIKKYPNWYKNKYLKNIKLKKKLYLICLRFNMYFLIKLIFKGD